MPGAVHGFLTLLLPAFLLADADTTRGQKVPGVIQGCDSLGSPQRDGANPRHPIPPGQGSRQGAAAMGRGVMPAALQGERLPPPDTGKQAGTEKPRDQGGASNLA